MVPAARRDVPPGRGYGEVRALHLKSSPQPPLVAATHFPEWLVTRILQLLPAQDARLLAQLLNEESSELLIVFEQDGWRVRRRRVSVLSRAHDHR